MGRQYGFHMDTSRCTGCKTCEMACRDAYCLGTTPSFRRVCECSGGSWFPKDGAWHHRVFAYYVALACNHCEDPVCQQVCPSGAMRKHDDGFVVLDSERCIGCRSCSYACPYKAPSFSKQLHVMRKCDGCRARVERGMDPICVESCPMRALDFGPIDELRARYGDCRDIAPLPNSAHTKPNITITPHERAQSSGSDVGMLANPKEI